VTSGFGERSGRGRQAEARRNDRSVLDAARLVFAAAGPEAPMSAVAAAAGVGMGSLYRRFASKDEMLQYLCEASLRQQAAAAEAAAAAGDDRPWEALADFIRECVSFRAGVFSSLAGRIPVTPVMAETARRVHETLALLVARAQRVGALRADVGAVDLHCLIELFSRRPADDEEAHLRLLGIALDGLRSPGGEPLPGTAREWPALAGRWLRGG
jgi:AcrR family transcriptional regulator